jgi:ribosomal protein S18 acetylase RimI-like enzyme
VAGLILRPARMEDAEALWRNCFSQNTLAETREYLAWCLRQMERGHLVRLVAEVDGQAAANAQLTLWRDLAEIGSLVVAEGYRRRGIAAALVDALAAEAQRRGARRLEIGARKSDQGLIDLYQRWGFVPHREAELPHLSGENRVVYLVKELTPPEQGEFLRGMGRNLSSDPDLSRPP